MTNPTPAERKPGLPGIRDYLITIPVHRVTASGQTNRAEMRVRLPAPSAVSAELLGQNIARLLDKRSYPDDGGPWRTAVDAVTAVDVDDTPAVDQLLAQLEHQKRILAALAAKLPMLLQVTPDEYAAADPDSVQAVLLGEMMVFLGSGQRWDVGPAEPLLLPADPADENILPGPHGGHHDPDVRQVRAGRLHELTQLGQVEIQDGAYWMPVESVTAAPTGATVIVANTQNLPFGDGDKTELTVPTPNQLINARPVTVASYGSDLVVAAYHSRQLLTADGWLTLLQGDNLGPLAHAVKVLGRRDDTGEIRQTSYDEHAAVLLRDDPSGWWPR